MSNTGIKEDSQVWKQLLDGDHNALSSLFRKYYRPLLNYGLKLIPSEDLVKDSIQELFFLIWDRRNRLSDVEFVRSYLYTSFRRTLFRQSDIREAWKRRDISYSEEFSDEKVNQEKMMIIRETDQVRNEQLRRALKALSEREEEAVFLKFYGGLSNEEIAEVMGVNRQSVYNYIYRAIEAMKEYLDSNQLNSSFIRKIGG